jgi:hypothetical protein
MMQVPLPQQRGSSVIYNSMKQASRHSARPANLMKMLAPRGVLVEDMGQTYLAEPDANGEESRTLRERLRLAQGTPAQAVLETVVEMRNWQGARLGPGRGRGVASVESFGVPCAKVVEVVQTPQGLRIEHVGWRWTWAASSTP